MEIRELSFSFPRFRGNGPQTALSAVVFPRPVIRAVAGMTGYSFGFVSEDHHVGLLNVSLDTVITNNVVEVRGQLGVRDWSGNWDDDYAGVINVAVLAELESATAPPTRGDLIITGAEITQAIQSFRSAQHLDSANVMPDNAIPLVAGKATGVRCWVDYDAGAGLPAISFLSGQLNVRSGGATTTLMAIAAIVPRPETEIDRGRADHTLNFRIPPEWCRGTVEIECRVFDATQPALQSAAYRRTLRFVDVNPVRVYGVGIHYTGQGLNLAAPTDVDLLNTLNYTRRTFPTGDVLLSGFTTVDFGEDLFTTDTSGCGDGFEDLLDVLRDLRGDSDDLFYGLLPNGINFGNFIGCGNDGVGSGTMGDGVTAAHEAGHAYGRQHAPCDSVTRCNNPSNQDDDYPQYGAFMSDSIGEYGYDPLANAVFDPANSSDFMGYSGNDWVSPYTYRALYARMDPPAFASMAAAAEIARATFGPAPLETALVTNRPRRGRPEWRRVKSRRLFLRVNIAHDRTVTILPSFSFAAASRIQQGRPTGYSVDVLDGHGQTIACEPLAPACYTCRPDCWPRHLHGEVPLDEKRGRTLVIRERDKIIHQVELPPPPKLHCRDPRYLDDGAAELSWQGSTEGGELYYLVHWQDEFGVWRGVAPRTTESHLAIPARFLKGRRHLKLRVLATNGLTTSECDLEIKGIRGELPIRVVTSPIASGVHEAWALDDLGRTLPYPGLAWYDEQGRELCRGAELDVRALGERPQVVRAVAIDVGAGRAEERLVLHEAAPPPEPPKPRPRRPKRTGRSEKE